MTELLRRYQTGGENTTGDVQSPIDGLRYELSARSRFALDTDVINRTQLYNVWLWRKFADQFRHPGVDDERWPGSPNGWRSEYWGKMMRGAALVCAWSGDEVLHGILTDTVRDFLTVADGEGRITTYSKDYEFNGWDMWGRKYVLLGLEYYLEICRDAALAGQIVETMRRHADYIMRYVGRAAEGKREINTTTQIWGGLNSSSILEPFVRLYNLTGDQRYLDFASYIVSEGGTSDENIFETAFEDQKAPYQYAYVKAYEMMSCFEGLIEYARVTGNEKYRQAAIRFGYKLLETDVTVIGCCGTTHELFDHSTKMQTKPADAEVMQETCVTVTWMKLCHQLLRLTGDRVFADAMEQSFCNAYLGALCDSAYVPQAYDNRVHSFTDGARRPFPAYVQLTFDSYSPLTKDIRGRKMAGMCVFPEDDTYYGCCVAIGAAGIGILGKSAIMKDAHGLTVQYYLDGKVRIPTADGEAVLKMETQYPYETSVRLTVEAWDASLSALRLRIPGWSRDTVATMDGKPLATDCPYLTVPCVGGEVIELRFDDRVRQILPPCPDGPDAGRYAAYAKGPVLLAADARLGNVDESVCADVDGAGFVPYELAQTPFAEIPDARLCVHLNRKDGTAVRLVDYSSAGKTYRADSACAVWLIK
ncbi:MAG: glycoside hydrolase family 127 protein [Clostridia bacterium]|nr:glycoside hydrolase family 127 protein [Clostridia bacterium]